jgi:HEAT repeat protein
MWFQAPTIDKLEANRDVRRLIALLVHRDAGVGSAAADALVRLGWEAAEQLCEAATSARNPDLRRAAWATLPRLGERAIYWLLRAMNDRDAQVRDEAADALLGIGNAAVEALCISAQDYRSEAGAAARRALESGSALRGSGQAASPVGANRRQSRPARRQDEDQPAREVSGGPNSGVAELDFGI